MQSPRAVADVGPDMVADGVVELIANLWFTTAYIEYVGEGLILLWSITMPLDLKFLTFVLKELSL